MRPGYDARRRNRNIGTARQGRGTENRFVIPLRSDATRTWWEQVRSFKVVKCAIAGRSITFVVEAARAGWVHACSISDLCRLLEIIPAADWDGIAGVVLRQSTRKQWTVNPSWGRLAYAANIGSRGNADVLQGPAILLEAVPPMQRWRWARHLDPLGVAELERLKADNHEVSFDGKQYTFRSSTEAIRNTQLFRTMLHEIGHWVHWLEHVERPAGEDMEQFQSLQDGFFRRPSSERESFAHRYAEVTGARLRKKGLIPFARSAG